VAQVITAKYADHVPFHRQVDIFAVMFPSQLIACFNPWRMSLFSIASAEHVVP
jgi:hypothetical protein